MTSACLANVGARPRAQRTRLISRYAFWFKLFNVSPWAFLYRNRKCIHEAVEYCWSFANAKAKGSHAMAILD